jgi:hypothetical protein
LLEAFVNIGYFIPNHVLCMELFPGVHFTD